jgi:hypothetical protein
MFILARSLRYSRKLSRGRSENSISRGINPPLEKTLAIGAALAALRFYRELVVIWLTGSGYIRADVRRQPPTLKKAGPEVERRA